MANESSPGLAAIRRTLLISRPKSRLGPGDGARWARPRGGERRGGNVYRSLARSTARNMAKRRDGPAPSVWGHALPSITLIFWFLIGASNYQRRLKRLKGHGQSHRRAEGAPNKHRAIDLEARQSAVETMSQARDVGVDHLTVQRGPATPRRRRLMISGVETVRRLAVIVGQRSRRPCAGILRCRSSSVGLTGTPGAVVLRMTRPSSGGVASLVRSRPTPSRCYSAWRSGIGRA